MTNKSHGSTTQWLLLAAAFLTAVPAQAQNVPRITIAADRDTIIGGLEFLKLTLTREAPFDDALTSTLQLTQDQNWLADTSPDVTFAAGDSTAVLILIAEQFSTTVVESGNLTAAADSVGGYDTSEARATVFVVSQEGPAIKVSLSHDTYGFQEDSEDSFVTVIARTAPGMPRGAKVTVSVFSESGTAEAGIDYQPVSSMITFPEADFVSADGLWRAEQTVSLQLIDDDVREGAESFKIVLDRSPGHTNELQLTNPRGARCRGRCTSFVEFNDLEDTPELDLSVSAATIREEEESSATATVAITNGKTFATDQVVTLAFAGTATEDTDYAVTPEDADDGTSHHQVIISAGSTSVNVTLTAVDDDIEDSNEVIEISATHRGSTIGSAQTIRILNQEAMPKITVAANRDTIIAGMEELEFTVTLEEPPDEDLTVTVSLTQEHNWVSNRSIQLNFPAESTIHELGLHESVFSPAVTESGNLTATVDPVSGYDTGDAAATVFVVSQEGPAMKVSFSHDTYRFQEDGEDPFVLMVAQAAAGMPRGSTVAFSVTSRRGTARSPGDYRPLSVQTTIPEAAFVFADGLWQAQRRLPLALIDDDVREGDESFHLILEQSLDHPRELQFSDIQGAPCQNNCRTPVEINDDEDTPVLELSLSEKEIHERGETSSTATVSITNGKTFADDQAMTFRLRGDAIPGSDYRVTPADADDQTPDHQVTLPAGSSSVEATFTARDDDREEGDEEVRISVIHDADAIGSGTIRIVDRFPRPRVEITFEGVQPPRDGYDDGIATGPFTTRIRFSEQVEGFTEEDIVWQTHSGTTVDTTNIGVLLWDYTAVRAGLEYTARMMPDQNGRLHIVVFPDSARSVATGDGNQLGHGSLQVELPPNRMMVEPRALTVDEGDEEGAHFVVLLTSEPTGTVTATVSGMDGTEVSVNWPTLTFQLPYWSGGWGVRVTAGADANTRDETVRLAVTASGGGYDGRRAEVLVTVRDSGAGSGGDSAGDLNDEAAALILVEGVTPEAAAVALFGENALSAAQLAALDRLGNRNGSYDLGDLLSWNERCRRASGPGSRDRDGRRRSRKAQRLRRRVGGLLRRRPSRPRRQRAPWFALLLVASATWSCADDVVQPTTAPDPGLLTVRLTAPPTARDIGALLVMEGPGIDSVRAPGFELFQSEASSPRHIVVAGTLATGPIAEFQVPDRALHAQYRARLLEVTGEDYQLRDLSGYEVTIMR